MSDDFAACAAACACLLGILVWLAAYAAVLAPWWFVPVPP